MATNAFLLIASFLLVLLVIAKPLGLFIARLIEGDMPSFVTKIEAVLWRFSGLKQPGREMTEMNWSRYALAILLFNLLGFVLLFALLLFQGSLPLNPQKFSGMSWDLAFNTAISFTTNTNWQSYSGENSLSYLS
ncbi:K+-transporting ATPase A subunit [Providencia alcalifaciens]|nr:K+-transporting ATPase A subunit [Providencia alcalifaciens]